MRMERATLEVQPATPADRQALERLWQLFQHEMSAFTPQLPNAEGRFRQERLDAALSDPGWAGYLLRIGDHAVGIALVRALDQDEHVLNTLFLVHGARRAGHGLAAARQVVAAHPGAWAVAFQEDNIMAAAFWRHVATTLAGADWWEESRAVPNRPDLASDRWIMFRCDRPLPTV